MRDKIQANGDGFVPGMPVQTSMGDGTAPEQPPIVEAKYADGMWRKSMSEIVFGRDISGLRFEDLKPEELRALAELERWDTFPGWLESIAAESFWPKDWAERLQEEREAARGYVQSVDLGSGRGSVVIPPGYENRKARRAAQAQQKRKAFKAYRAGRREGLSHETALQALADPRGFAEVLQREIAARKAKEQSGGTDS